MGAEGGSESLVELGWLVTGLVFSAPTSEHFSYTLLSKANRWGVLQARLAPGEGGTERCLWCEKRLSCLLWIALDLLLKKSVMALCHQRQSSLEAALKRARRQFLSAG